MFLSKSGHINFFDTVKCKEGWVGSGVLLKVVIIRKKLKHCVTLIRKVSVRLTLEFYTKVQTIGRPTF